jgi:hypothetical protein
MPNPAEVARMILDDAARDAYTPGWRDPKPAERYSFDDWGDPSELDLIECVFVCEDLPKLEAAALKAVGQRLELLTLLVSEIRRQGGCE